MAFKDMTWLANDMAGVYILYRDQEVLYVGQSVHVPSRLRTHRKAKIIPFNRVMVDLCGVEHMHGLEYQLINQHRPQYNTREVPAVAITYVHHEIDLEALGLIPKRPSLLKAMR